MGTYCTFIDNRDNVPPYVLSTGMYEVRGYGVRGYDEIETSGKQLLFLSRGTRLKRVARDEQARRDETIPIKTIVRPGALRYVPCVRKYLLEE